MRARFSWFCLIVLKDGLPLVSKIPSRSKSRLGGNFNGRGGIPTEIGWNGMHSSFEEFCG